MAKRRSITLMDQLRRAIEAAGESRYKICQSTGIDQSSLGKFVRDEGGLSLDNIDKLAHYLGLELVQARKKGT
jgi:transcriptional regulator with XRE-family HTH domain